MSRLVRRGVQGAWVALFVVVSGFGDLAAECLTGDDLRVRSTSHAGVEAVDGGEVLRGELEVEHVEVLGHAGRRD